MNLCIVFNDLENLYDGFSNNHIQYYSNIKYNLFFLGGGTMIESRGNNAPVCPPPSWLRAWCFH